MLENIEILQAAVQQIQVRADQRGDELPQCDPRGPEVTYEHHKMCLHPVGDDSAAAEVRDNRQRRVGKIAVFDGYRSADLISSAEQLADQLEAFYQQTVASA